MNDPHVKSLVYRLETDKTLEFKSPPPLDTETPGSSVHLADGLLTLTMKDHYPSPNAARQAVQSFLDAWELDWALNHGRREMKFVYETANVVDREPPPPGTTVINPEPADMMWKGSDAAAVLSVPAYPPPPSAFKVSPDVETLWNRYEQYVEEHDTLAGMAWFCFNTALPKGSSEASSKSLNICRKVLKKLGRLAGGKGERKNPSQGPYSAQEKAWLEAAIRRLIRRVGEQAAGVQDLRQITMDDLPKL